MITSQLSGYCDVIKYWLWRQQQNVNPASEARGRCVKIFIFIIIFIVVMLCKKWNNVCTLVRNCFCTHSSVILVFVSLIASQLQTKKKITLSLEVKQFIHYSLYNLTTTRQNTTKLCVYSLRHTACPYTSGLANNFSSSSMCAHCLPEESLFSGEFRGIFTNNLCEM